MRIRVFALLALTIVLFAFGDYATLAQDLNPTEAPVVAPMAQEVVSPLEEAAPAAPLTCPTWFDPACTGQLFINAISKLIPAIFMASPLTVAAVSVLKRWSALDSIPAPTLVFVVALILWGIGSIVNYAGYGEQFVTVQAILERLVQDFAPLLLGLGATTVIAPKYFDALAENKVPVLGYKRTVMPMSKRL